MASVNVFELKRVDSTMKSGMLTVKGTKDNAYGIQNCMGHNCHAKVRIAKIRWFTLRRK